MRRLLADAWTARELCDGWELAGTLPGLLQRPDRLDELDWMATAVPATVGAALAAHDLDDGRLADLDAWDWWFRTTIEGWPSGEPEQAVLWLDGLATVAEVYLDGELILESQSMFRRHAVAGLEGCGESRELAVCLRALRPLLEVRRKPRARWRTQLVRDANLRFFRTALVGRAPGLAAGPPIVGPYRPIVLERRCRVTVDDLRLRAAVDGGEGRVSLRCALATIPVGGEVEAVTVSVTGPGSQAEAELAVERSDDGFEAAGELMITDPQLWWPHTHGSPVLYDVELRVRTGGGEPVTVQAGRIGFRDLRIDRELERDGFALSCNGTRLFVRGAVWMPLESGEGQPAPPDVRAALEQVVAAGMNMLRVPGIACYEDERFHECCDELGILVWQDFMFANLDYPELDPDFMQTVEEEARTLLDELGHRPSLAVLCGGSEVAQQVAMLGLDPELASGPLYGNLLPGVVREAGVQAAYVPSTPWGGDLPFRPDRGVANYYGVGAYRRPLNDARLADVRFAAECLAFSNVPDADGVGIDHPQWKRGVPRDAGAGWDFEDVRDHYLQDLYGVEPVSLRSVDPGRYLELSRHVTGEVMATVFGEWRREASACAGGLVLWTCDLRPGAGWGLLDHRGEPKVALHHLGRVLAPVAVWGSDEGLGGIQAHVANDGHEPLAATLRVSLYRDRETLVGEAEEAVRLPAHGIRSLGVEALLGRFVDVSWAYRFGPPAQDLVVLSLEQRSETDVTLLSQSFLHPIGRPRHRTTADRLGLEATLRGADGATPVLRIASRGFAHGVRVDMPGFRPSDNAFSIEPGHARDIELRREGQGADVRGAVTALNLHGSVRVAPARTE
jgi:beta-mannosidase